MTDSGSTRPDAPIADAAPSLVTGMRDLEHLLGWADHKPTTPEGADLRDLALAFKAEKARADTAESQLSMRSYHSPLCDQHMDQLKKMPAVCPFCRIDKLVAERDSEKARADAAEDVTSEIRYQLNEYIHRESSLNKEVNAAMNQAGYPSHPAGIEMAVIQAIRREQKK